MVAKMHLKYGGVGGRGANASHYNTLKLW